MGKVIDTAGEKIIDTRLPIPPGPGTPGLVPPPIARSKGPVEREKTITPTLTAAIAAFSLVMIVGFGLLYAQNLQSGSRVEARMARMDQVDERFDALIAKLDAVGTRMDGMSTRLQATSNRVESLGNQVSTGLRDANRSLAETVNTSMNTLSQRLSAQQQQQVKEQREREQREKEREQKQQQQASPPRSPTTAPDPFSQYPTAPGSIRPRRAFP